MFILTIYGKEDEGAYSVQNEDGEQILYLFEEEDDASRYAMMLEDDGYPEMQVIEIDHELLIKACKNYGYNYTVISANDIVIPPRSNKNDFI
jgi:hypothetical protein